VNKYSIPIELIDTFLNSMEMDLNKQFYSKEQYELYILGSAEVVGLMCLKVFVEGNDAEYERLKPSAMKLGSAFQKINFLRDLKDDFQTLGRTYFPGINMEEFNATVKKEIEADIEADFRAGYEGILQLPKNARFGVYMAYKYYFKLFKKIKAKSAQNILTERIRIPNYRKMRILLTSYVRHNLNML
jgi:phytoene/squalene synthetase